MTDPSSSLQIVCQEPAGCFDGVSGGGGGEDDDEINKYNNVREVKDHSRIARGRFPPIVTEKCTHPSPGIVDNIKNLKSSTTSTITTTKPHFGVINDEGSQKRDNMLLAMIAKNLGTECIALAAHDNKDNDKDHQKRDDDDDDAMTMHKKKSNNATQLRGVSSSSSEKEENEVLNKVDKMDHVRPKGPESLAAPSSNSNAASSSATKTMTTLTYPSLSLTHHHDDQHRCCSFPDGTVRTVHAGANKDMQDRKQAEEHAASMLGRSVRIDVTNSLLSSATTKINKVMNDVANELLQNAYESFAILVDSRIRAYVTFLTRHHVASLVAGSATSRAQQQRQGSGGVRDSSELAPEHNKQKMEQPKNGHPSLSPTEAHPGSSDDAGSASAKLQHPHQHQPQGIRQMIERIVEMSSSVYAQAIVTRFCLQAPNVDDCMSVSAAEASNTRKDASTGCAACAHEPSNSPCTGTASREFSKKCFFLLAMELVVPHSSIAGASSTLSVGVSTPGEIRAAFSGQKMDRENVAISLDTHLLLKHLMEQASCVVAAIVRAAGNDSSAMEASSGQTQQDVDLSDGHVQLQPPAAARRGSIGSFGAYSSAWSDPGLDDGSDDDSDDDLDDMEEATSAVPVVSPDLRGISSPPSGFVVIPKLNLHNAGSTVEEEDDDDVDVDFADGFASPSEDDGCEGGDDGDVLHLSPDQCANIVDDIFGGIDETILAPTSPPTKKAKYYHP